MKSLAPPQYDKAFFLLFVALFALMGCHFDLADVQALPSGTGDGSVLDGGVDVLDEASEGSSDGFEGSVWPETSVGDCTDKGDCSPNEFCNEVGKCEKCVGTWTPTEGGSHCGEDWFPTDGEVIAGEHWHVGRFEVTEGSMVHVKTHEGGSIGALVVRAQMVHIAGTLSAAGAGHAGGTPGGGGGSTASGSAGTAGTGDFGGSPGGGGGGGGSACIQATFHAHASGGNGSDGISGGYAPASSCQSPLILIGSGGGGGGGGGGGQRSTCCDLSVAGGAGGTGGQGGAGGGSISLFGYVGIEIPGIIRTTGAGGQAGQSGATGDEESKKDPGSGCGPCGGCADHRYAYCLGMGPCGSAQNDCCQRPCCYYYLGGTGGNGGPGGHGAGGGVLLQAPSIAIPGFIDALGGNNQTSNGGTVSILHQGTAPSLDGIAAGLVCTLSL